MSEHLVDQFNIVQLQASQRQVYYRPDSDVFFWSHLLERKDVEEFELTQGKTHLRVKYRKPDPE